MTHHTTDDVLRLLRKHPTRMQRLAREWAASATAVFGEHLKGKSA